MTYKWDFFLAHAGADTEAAEVLYQFLAPRSRVYLDSRCLELGDNWDIELPQAQRASRVTVVLVSQNTDQAYYQREEIAAAIALARNDAEAHRVVPVFLDAASKTADSTPYGLTVRHSITLSGDVDLRSVANGLLELIGPRTELHAEGIAKGTDLQDGVSVTVLLLAADPHSEYGLETEIDLITDSVRSGSYGGRIKLEVVQDVTVNLLHLALNQFRPEVLHFCGGVSEGQVMLCDPDGGPHPCPSSVLGELLSLLGTGTKLAVINSCWSAGIARRVTESVDCAIGVEGVIFNEAAMEFADALYRALAFGHSVKAAFDQALVMLRLKGWGPDAPSGVHADLKHVAQDTIARDIVSISAGTPRADSSVPRLFWRPSVDPSEVYVIGPGAA